MPNFIQPQYSDVVRKAVHYKNRFGIKISANLYYSKNIDLTSKNPAIVIGPPYSGVKEQGPHVYAQNLARKGYITLAFDPSFNGESSGWPRHVSDPSIFVEDFSAGIDYLGTREFVDRKKLAALGICGSGGFALSAAQVDPRIKATVTASMIDIAGSATRNFSTKEEIMNHLKSVANQRYEDFEVGSAKLGPRGACLQVDWTKDPVYKEFGEFYSTERGYHPNSVTQFTETSDQAFFNFSLLDHLDWLGNRPVMVISGEKSFSRPLQEMIYNQIPGPKEQIIVKDANHIDLYDSVEKIPWDKINHFLKQSLA